MQNLSAVHLGGRRFFRFPMEVAVKTVTRVANTLLAAAALTVPLAGASAQMPWPSISGWADSPPLADDRVPPAETTVIESLPPPLPWAADREDRPDQDVSRWQDQVAPIPAPPPYQQAFPDDRSMPRGWSPGYPNNTVGAAPPSDGYPTVLGHRPAPARGGIPTAPQTPTFDQPNMEAPGAVTAMRGNSRSEAAVQTLLDQGYSRINPVEPDGKGFVTYAERDGAQMRLFVDPDTGEIARLPD